MFKLKLLLVVTLIVCSVGCEQPEKEIQSSGTQSKKAAETSSSDSSDELTINKNKNEISLGTSSTFDAKQLAKGSVAYKKGMCDKCHGRNGSGTPRGPDLTDAIWIHCENTPDEIHRLLLAGVPKSKLHDKSRPFAMNPATNLISDDSELAALSHYVRSLQKDQQ